MTPECERLGLIATPVVIDLNVELLRQIRNACRDGFAYDNHEITPSQQLAWWQAMAGDVKAWLYWYPYAAALVGYGMLRRDRITNSRRWWSSVAVLPEQTGNGYGGAITADLIRRHDGPVYAQARLDRPAAMRLHREVDWRETGRDERLVSYVTLPHVYLGEPEASWALEGWALT